MNLSNKSHIEQILKQLPRLLSTSNLLFLSFFSLMVYSILSLVTPFAQGDIPGKAHVIMFFALMEISALAATYVSSRAPPQKQIHDRILRILRGGLKYGLLFIFCASYVHLAYHLAVQRNQNAMAESIDQYIILINTLVFPVEVIIVPLFASVAMLLATAALFNSAIESYQLATRKFDSTRCEA